MIIGLLGGSFDPPHVGHLIAAERALEQLKLSQVRFVVARQQPFKVGAHAASPKDRLDMVRAATAGRDVFIPDDREFKRLGPSYTVDTLEEMRSEFPDDQLVFMVGSDAAAQLERWRSPDRIAELARVIAIPRPGFPVEVGGYISGTIEMPELAFSSVRIRENLSSGQSVRYQVPDAVLEIITSRGLYQSGD